MNVYISYFVSAYNKYFSSNYIVMRCSKLFDIYIFLINFIRQYRLLVICSYAYLVLVLLSLFVCSLYVFVNAHYICTCIWSMTCAGVLSLTADVIWIESRSPILWTTERNRSLHVPVPSVWKSIIMIFQSHHVLSVLFSFGGGKVGGVKR